MSTREKDGLMDCLFSRQDRRLLNIKFMRGTGGEVAPGALRAEICSILSQRDNGLPATGAAKSGRVPTDIRKVVADL